MSLSNQLSGIVSEGEASGTSTPTVQALTRRPVNVNGVTASEQVTLTASPEDPIESTVDNTSPSFSFLPQVLSTALDNLAASDAEYSLLDFSLPPKRPQLRFNYATDPVISHTRRQIISDLDFGNDEQFGSSIRDFIESNCPSGCKPESLKLAPLSMKNSIDAECNQHIFSDVSLFEQLPRLRTGTVAYEFTDRENHSDIKAQHDGVLVGPDAPVFGRWGDGSDFSFDGTSRKRAGTGGDTIRQDILENDDVSPTSNVLPQSALDSPAEGRQSSEDTPVHQERDSDACMNITPGSERASGNNDTVVLESTPEAFNSVTSREDNTNEVCPNNVVIASQPPIPGVPRDITGELPSPKPRSSKMPKGKHERRKSMLRRIQKFYRKARSALLRRKMLDLIVGRQLSKSTRDNLVAISKGLPAMTIDLASNGPSTPESIPS